MRGTSMHLYKTLYTITERPEKVEMSSFVSDLQDLGLRDAFCSTEPFGRPSVLYIICLPQKSLILIAEKKSR
jgi:hypothetical protein